MELGMVGLGRMGANMARRLRSKSRSPFHDTGRMGRSMILWYSAIACSRSPLSTTAWARTASTSASSGRALRA